MSSADFKEAIISFINSLASEPTQNGAEGSTFIIGL